MYKSIVQTDRSTATIIIRLMVGMVFLSEGIQKFLFPAIRGAGRFEKIGLPWSEFLGSFVGVFEIGCGVMILFGLLTRLAAIPTLVIMLVALATTKSQVLADEGFWAMMHGSRTDWAMLLVIGQNTDEKCLRNGQYTKLLNSSSNWAVLLLAARQHILP